MASLFSPKTCRLLGAPIQDGAGRPGCDMGPSAFRAAGIIQALTSLGHRVEDLGAVVPAPIDCPRHPNPALKNLAAVAGWTQALAQAVYQASAEPNDCPITLGGDHSLAAGTLTGLARRAAERGQEFFVLWLDAHSDFHSLASSKSGNLHGVPMAYAIGQPGFEGYFPPPMATVKAGNVCMMGLRSVDPDERSALEQSGVIVHDMRQIDEFGVVPLLRTFLRRVQSAQGTLHVSLDVDFLEPSIAPGVGTTVPGGATFREAHLIMEMVFESGLVSSVDLAELNPFLDDRGRTAVLMVDLLASLMGRRVLGYPTRSFRS